MSLRLAPISGRMNFPSRTGGIPESPWMPLPRNKSHQHGFGIVIGLVAEGHLVVPVIDRRALEKSVTGLAQFFFQRAAGRFGDLSQMTRQVERS